MKRVSIVLFIFVMLESALLADENNLSNILKKSDKLKPLKKIKEKKDNKISHYHFTFENEMNKKGKKPETFEYKNSSRFKFQFTSDPSNNNLMRGSSMDSGASGAHGGGGRGR